MKIKHLDSTKYMSQKKESLNELNLFSEIGKISCGLLHDIINPITGLLLYLEILLKNKDENSEMYNFIKPIEKSSQSIKKFIQAINEHVNSPNETQIVNLEKIILSTIEIFKPKSLKNNVSILFIRKYNKYLIIGNPIKFFQCVINILSNAIDSFEKKSATQNIKRKVLIKLEYTENGLNFTIKDNGSGIETKNLQKIFEPNYTNKENGFGQGLKHTKNILEKDFDSKIFVFSRKDKGTFFKIIFNENRVVGIKK
jgi:signal transduction histidine kinase